MSLRANCYSGGGVEGRGGGGGLGADELGGGGVWEEATSEDGVRCAVCAMELEDQQEQ